MTRINIDYTFMLENGLLQKISVKDIKENIESTEITALADLLIQKTCHHNGSAFSSLKKCIKYSVDEEVIV